MLLGCDSVTRPLTEKQNLIRQCVQEQGTLDPLNQVGGQNLLSWTKGL